MKALPSRALVLCTMLTVILGMQHAISNEIDQQIVPDEVSLTNQHAESKGAKRVSDDDIIGIHHFKLKKGTWKLSYKPGNTSSVPLVWCDLHYMASGTNQVGRKYKSFSGMYSDVFNSLSVDFRVFEDGMAVLEIRDLKESTSVDYYLDSEGNRFMQAVYKNN